MIHVLHMNYENQIKINFPAYCLYHMKSFINQTDNEYCTSLPVLGASVFVGPVFEINSRNFLLSLLYGILINWNRYITFLPVIEFSQFIGRICILRLYYLRAVNTYCRG